jgi:N-acetylglucosaminyldiphosphoundecaprenol N-acetyl-beta-D-mannosaminyltransferase
MVALANRNMAPLNAPGLSSVRVLGTDIHRVTMSQTIQLVQRAIERRERLRIGVVNAAKLVHMCSDERLREDVRSSDLVLADGMAVVWAARLLGLTLPERVAGIDLMMEMFRRGHERGYRVYCLGATRDVLDKVINRIHADYPGLAVAGSHDGYFSEADSATVAQEIAHSGAQILLAAMSSPKKENFLAKFSDQLEVPVCHGVGGSFDVFAGLVKRAPQSWQNLGLEWLYRVKQEPRRLWKRYLVTNVQFLVLLTRELVGVHVWGSRSSVAISHKER